MRQEKDKKKIEKKENLKHDDALKILQPLILTGKKGLFDMAVMKFMAEGRLKGEHLRDIYLRSLLFFKDDTKDVISSEGGEEDGRKAIRGIVDEYRKEREKRERVERILDQMVEKVGLGKGDVKIEMDEEGAKRVRGEGVQGLEEGGKIYLDGERFDPDKKEDKVTLGHEIGHVIQMKKGEHMVSSRYAEAEAERLGKTLVEGGSVEKPIARMETTKMAARTESNRTDDIDKEILYLESIDYLSLILQGYKSEYVNLLINKEEFRNVIRYSGDNEFVSEARNDILRILDLIAESEYLARQSDISHEKEFLDKIVETYKYNSNMSTIISAIAGLPSKQPSQILINAIKKAAGYGISMQISKLEDVVCPKPQWISGEVHQVIAEGLFIPCYQLICLVDAVIRGVGNSEAQVSERKDKPNNLVYQILKRLSKYPEYSIYLEHGGIRLFKNRHINPYNGQPLQEDEMLPIKDIVNKDTSEMTDKYARQRFGEMKLRIIMLLTQLAWVINVRKAYEQLKPKMKRMHRELIGRTVVNIVIGFPNSLSMGLAIDLILHKPNPFDLSLRKIAIDNIIKIALAIKSYEDVNEQIDGVTKLINDLYDRESQISEAIVENVQAICERKHDDR